MGRHLTLITFSIMVALLSACAGRPPLHQSTLQLARESPFIDVTVHECHDGDTCTISLNDPFLPPVFAEKISIRLKGINTWEIKGRCPNETALAKEARDYLRAQIAKGIRIDVVAPQRDKYFRLLGYLVVDGENLSDALLRAGHAHPYNGGTKPPPPCAVQMSYTPQP
jgi:micrococcal nuclease